jgi:cysteine synthase
LALSGRKNDTEGTFTGISGGATYAISMEIAERADLGPVILRMLPILPSTILRHLCSKRLKRICRTKR